MAGRGKRKGDNGFEDWGGYMAAKISKLENQYANELMAGAEKERISNIFSGIAIFVNGYTTPTAEELKRIMISHGGIYHHYYNSNTTTHIIASNLCGAKIKKLKGDEKFVKPEWIADSVKANALLDFKPYLLYTGTTLDKGQQKLALAPVPKNTEQDVPQQTSETLGENVNPAIQEAGPSTSKKPAVDARRAGEDDFLANFYNRSRLHHISTMGAHFKRLVTEMRENSDGSFPGLEELEKWKEEKGCSGLYEVQEPVLMHIDMDCFFVSVGLRNHPELRGKPVVVTHGKADSKPKPREGSNREFEFDCYKEHWIKKSKFVGENETTASVAKVFPRLQDMDETCSMSEIASASYEARAAGIYNGMFMGAALKLCPSLTVIPYDFQGYQEVSTLLYNTVATYTLDIEAVSCDEMYADITSILRRSGLSPGEFATHLREVIFSKTQCNASVGMGPSMLIARLATKKAKPNNVFHVRKSEIEEFMKSHKVDDLPGVGRSITHRLTAMGIKTCAEMQQIALGRLKHEFGQKQGETLYHMCRGEDKRILKTGHIRKSISAEVNYGIRFANEQELYKFTHELSCEVSKRMEEIQVRGQLLSLKLKTRAKDAPVETAKFMGHGVCDNISRSMTMAAATRDPSVIHKEVMSLLRQLKVDFRELRGMGIQMSKLVVDNVKGKQTGHRTLLNFVARSRPAESVDKVPEEPPAALPAPAEMEERSMSPANPPLFELPSASQIDPAVFDQLPDDVKKDIMQDYKRKGINLPQTTARTTMEPVAGPSSRPDDPVSYERINEVSDIDSSYWSALPDDIKAEIEKDIKQRKAEATSPSKKWNEIFRPRPSPTKAPSNKGIKRKAKAAPEVSNVEKILKIQPIVNLPQPAAKEEPKEELSFCGATSLPEIRQLLEEWFSSSGTPEAEDRDAISNFLASLVNHRHLDRVEPIILFLKRMSADKNSDWKKAVEDIINHVQLYVIQYYNAPLKLSV